MKIAGMILVAFAVIGLLTGAAVPAAGTPAAEAAGQMLAPFLFGGLGGLLWWKGAQNEKNGLPQRQA